MRALCFSLFIILTVAGCTTVKPATLVPPEAVVPRSFSHAAFDRVVKRFVDDQGRVDYAALKNDPQDLEQYYLQLATISPDSHPQLFPTHQSKLAYWLNAYNAAVIKIVLSYYPISSVSDVKHPWLFFFLPGKGGFFLFQRVTFGGKTTSLYFLENGVIRKRFADPRVHFALNCAARGCPRLPREAFTPEDLEQQLDREARRFLAEERNFRIDPREKAVYLSSIFAWYRKDFIEWYHRREPDREATLLNYVVLYVPPEKAEDLRSAEAYALRFIPYDWRLNDQRPPTRTAQLLSVGDEAVATAQE